MGLAAAVKWQGVYAILGVPVIIIFTLYKRYCEYRSAKAEATLNDSIWNVKYFRVYTVITLASCVIFLAIIPVGIYLLSYIPYLQTPNQNGFDSIIKNQVDMFNYHSQLVSDHVFSSHWFTWPFMLCPMRYYSMQLENGLRSSITAFGNPAVWWVGIVAFLYCVRAISKRFDKVLFYLLVAYASQLLPWLFIGRTTYIYHYFPSVPFVILMITYMFKHWAAPRKPIAVIMYLLLALVLFIAFYPAISGFPIPTWYLDSLLTWKPTWRF